MQTTKPKGLAKIWREIKRPFRQVFGRSSSSPINSILSSCENPEIADSVPADVEPKLIKRYCPVCQHGSEKIFEDFNGHTDRRCAYCGSLERHRFIWLALGNQLCRQEHSNCSLLHFAPESCFSQHFEFFFGDNYITGDLEPGRAKQVVDITNICFPENTFDYIYCCRVLEHIIDDITALKELYRVLKPGGTAYLSVPLRGEKTYEDYSITSPEERTKHFGQWDHVRFYGTDIIERIISVGFSVEVKTLADFVLHEGLRETLGFRKIMKEEKLFIAKKVIKNVK